MRGKTEFWRMPNLAAVPSLRQARASLGWRARTVLERVDRERGLCPLSPGVARPAPTISAAARLTLSTLERSQTTILTCPPFCWISLCKARSFSRSRPTRTTIPCLATSGRCRKAVATGRPGDDVRAVYLILVRDGCPHGYPRCCMSSQSTIYRRKDLVGRYSVAGRPPMGTVRSRAWGFPVPLLLAPCLDEHEL